VKSCTTFVLIKPDAMDRRLVGRIIARIEDTNLMIHHYQERHKTNVWARAHYAHVDGQWFFDQLVEFMTSRSMLGFEVSGPYVIERLRMIAGSTCSWEAGPGTIRGDMGGYPAFHNLIHVSDSFEAYNREWTLFSDPKTDVHPDNFRTYNKWKS